MYGYAPPDSAALDVAVLVCLAVLLYVVAAFRVCPTRRIAVTRVDLVAMLYAIYWTANTIFVSHWQVAPWVIISAVITIGCYVAVRLTVACNISRDGDTVSDDAPCIDSENLATTVVLWSILISGLVQSLIAAAQIAGVVASRHSEFALTGSFANPGPLGGYLALSSVAAVVLVLKYWITNRRMAVVVISLSLPVVAMLIYADSRAGWLAAALAVAYIAVGRVRRHRALLAVSALSLLAIGVVVLFGYRPDSARGRLLIWRVSADMIADAPMVGSGTDSFREEYMFRQAHYFEQNPNSPYADTADNISYPFNELIKLLCQHGMVGGTLVTALILMSLFGAGGIRGAPLVCLLTFSMFSYPFELLPFVVILPMLVALLAAGSGAVLRIRFGLPVAMFTLALMVTLLWMSTLLDPYDPVKLVQQAERLMQNDEPQTQDVQQLETIARRIPSAQIYTDLGAAYIARGEWPAARECYSLASNMCPRLLRPRYGLFRVAQMAADSGCADRAAARDIALSIVAMPIKIESTYTIRIKAELQDFLIDTTSQPVP